MFNPSSYDIYSVLNLDSPVSCSGQDGSHHNECQEEFDRYFNMRQEVKEKIDELPTTTESEGAEFEDDGEEDQEAMKVQEAKEQFTSHGLSEDQEAMKASQEKDQFTSHGLSEEDSCQEQILFSREKIACRNASFSGYGNETQNMGKHLQTSTSVFLGLLLKTRQLDSEEELAAKQFTTKNGGVADFRRLFGLQGLSQKCREYYESSSFIQSILTSGKMDFKSRMAMLRHIEKFRRMTLKEPENWKMDYI